MPRILLIDDDAPLRTVLRHVLANAGHTVVEAVDGRQAIRLLHDELLDLVITDVVMPNVDGIETIMAARQQHPALPVIAMSGAPAHGRLFLEIAAHLGVRQTLIKPFEADVLLRTVDTVLERTTAA